MGFIIEEWQQMVNVINSLCKQKQKVSSCCGVPPATEWHEEGFICSECGEHCDWIEE